MNRQASAASGLSSEAASSLRGGAARASWAALLVAAAACGGPPQPDTPTAAYERLLDELRLGELGPATGALLTPQDVALRQRLERELRRTGQELTEGIARIEPVEERIDGRWALVVTLIARPRGTDTTRFVRDEYLYREDGGWKVVPEAIRSDPAVQPLVDASAQRLFDWYRGHREELEARYATPGARGEGGSPGNRPRPTGGDDGDASGGG